MRRLPVALVALTAAFATAADRSSGAEFPLAPEGTFSIAVIPDTQHYRGRRSKAEPDSTQPVTNSVFQAYVAWIQENLDRQRIVFVSHVGDIVDVNSRDQWLFARRMMDRLHGHVPYGISVGNHDMTSRGDSSLFQEFFPASRFADFEWYGGHFQASSREPAVSGNNANNYQLVSAAGMDFVFLHLECNAPDEVLAWADGILRKHAKRRAMITTHMFLGPRERPQSREDYFDGPKGRMQWKKCHGRRGNTPQQMWEKCFRKHANLFMICCGDQSRTQAIHRSDRADSGNTVYQLLSDYGASGMRVMRFVPSRNGIEVRTWNPMTQDFCRTTNRVRDASQHQFELDYEMPSGESHD